LGDEKAPVLIKTKKKRRLDLYRKAATESLGWAQSKGLFTKPQGGKL